MCFEGARCAIITAVAQWEGITVQPHRHGGTEFVVGRREIGHIHGDDIVDIPFPRWVRDEVVEHRLAVAHRILPDSGWVSVWIDRDDDVERAIKLLHRSYLLMKEQRPRQDRMMLVSEMV